jgi:hypothetical protein
MQQLASSRDRDTFISFKAGPALLLALATTGVAFTQIATAQASQASATAISSPVANVYVQTKKGIEVFSASSTGKLTEVKGSPFSDSGQMGAINSSHLVSVGTDYLHVYPIESTGAVGKQVSEIDTQKYGGAQCGPNNGGALFDHTGKYLYVQLLPPEGGDGPCSAVQSYKIGSNGELTFLGDEENDSGYHGQPSAIGISTISGNDQFAYGAYSNVYASAFSAFRRESAGAMMTNGSFSEVDPKPNPAGANGPGSNDDFYYPELVAADPTNHLAVVVYKAFSNAPPLAQMASYTINSNGSITSTNSWDDMPALASYPGTIAMSWTGKQVAVGGTGIEVFNFNGAAPMTKGPSLSLPSRSFRQLAWDKDNHLYAIDYATGNLYVYTVTAKSITPAPGSPYTIPENANDYSNQYDLIVVPK